MRVEELSYALPDELVARYPSDRRDRSRLLVIGDDRLDHRIFDELPALLPAGALLVVNDTRVRWARLFGHKTESGGRVEVLLVRAEADGVWQALARSSGRLRAGTLLSLGDSLQAQVLEPTDEHGVLRLRIEVRTGEPIETVLAREGHVPLPPYLHRDDEPLDKQRYQTVFARQPGAVAAPTAGLHFTDELLTKLADRGVLRASLTLHVGPGTFRPVSSDDLADHPMHSEAFEVPAATVAAVAAARQRGAPVVAVGTTVVRALESAADEQRPGHIKALAGETVLLIQPGYRFAVVDGLITNFHLPKSTLLALIYAFAGTSRAREAYRQAVAQRYRFYSYGDAMFIPHGSAAAARPVSGEQP